MNARNFEDMIPLLQPGQNIRHYCDVHAEQLIYINLGTLRLRDPTFTVNKDSPLSDIFEAMTQYYQSDLLLSKAADMAKDIFYEWFKNPAETKLENEKIFQDYCEKLIKLQEKIEKERLPADQIVNVIKTVKNNLGKSSKTNVKVTAVVALRNGFDDIDKTAKFPTTLPDFQMLLGYHRLDLLKAIKKVDDMGMLQVGNKKRNNEMSDSKSQGGRGEKRGRQNEYNYRPQFDRRTHKRLCYICNLGSHAEGDCRYFNHPDGNHENQPFEQSTKGKLWIAKGYYKLPRSETLDGSVWEDPSQQQQQSSHNNSGRGRYNPHRGGGRGHSYRGGRGGQSQREYNRFYINDNKKRLRDENNQELLNAIKARENSHNNNNFALLHIMPQVVDIGEAEEEDIKIPISTLFDSGATSKNYISTQVAQELESKGAKLCDCNKEVCSALGSKPICKKSIGTMQCTIVHKDEFKKEYKDNIEATIIESSLDLILGRETIKDLNIVDKFPSHFKHLNPNKDNTNEKDTASDFERMECTPGRRYPKSDNPSVDSLNVLTHRDNRKLCGLINAVKVIP
jgi:hypothetical protein